MNNKNQNIISTCTENFEFVMEPNSIYSLEIPEIYPKNSNQQIMYFLKLKTETFIILHLIKI